MPRALYVAVGGGGDALAAALLHYAYDRSADPLIATMSWDRLIIDPLPGPRHTSDFIGLTVDRGVHNVVAATTRTVPPAGSTLPRLASALTGRLQATLVLLDPHAGVLGLETQLRNLANTVHTDAITAVDVGGDVLAVGDEPNLRSPLADAMIISAIIRSELAGELWMAGPGVDGELSAAEVSARLPAVRAEQLPSPDPAIIRQALPILEWNPSESTALFVAAVDGVRGRVDIRSGGMPVDLTPSSATVWRVPGQSLVEGFPLAGNVLDVSSLAEADSRITNMTGRSEIAFEAMKARGLRRHTEPDYSVMAQYVADCRAGGIDFATYRRLAELVRERDQRALRDAVSHRWPTSDVDALWRVPVR